MKKSMSLLVILMVVFFVGNSEVFSADNKVDNCVKIKGPNQFEFKGKIVKFSLASTLWGIVKYFNFKKEERIEAMKKLSQLNGMIFTIEKYLANDRSLWLYEGKTIKIPLEFIENEGKFNRKSYF